MSSRIYPCAITGSKRLMHSAVNTQVRKNKEKRKRDCCGNARVPSDALLSRLRNAADSHIDIGDLIPGWIIHYPGLGQVEDSLESADGARGERAIYAVGSDHGDGRVIAGDAV